MPKTPTHDELHEHHEKHLQLGAEATGRGRRVTTNAARDALWADATTVEDFAAGLEELKTLPPAKVKKLRAAREG